MIKAAFTAGVEAAQQRLAPEAEPSLLRRSLPYLAALGAAGGGYAALRRFNPSAIPELARLQHAAEGKKFEVATTRPAGRDLRSWLFGAKDIPHTQQTATLAAPFAADRPGSVVLHHTGGARSPVHGAADINAGQLPDLMDDKYMFSQLMGPMGTSGGATPGLPGAIPETQLLRQVLQQNKGDLEAVKRQFPKGYVIKPRSGSMSKAEQLITHETSANDPRLRAALQNPAEHIIQEKIPIQREFRVHTLNNVPFSATHRRIPNETLSKAWDAHMGDLGGGGAFVPAMGKTRADLMDFVRNSTKHLGVNPQGENILGTHENFHHAVDVAQLPDGSFKLIESNPTPGTLMNPVIARKLQRAATGRWDRGTSALGGLAAGGAAYGGARALEGLMEEETPVGGVDA